MSHVSEIMTGENYIWAPKDGLDGAIGRAMVEATAQISWGLLSLSRSIAARSYTCSIMERSHSEIVSRLTSILKADETKIKSNFWDIHCVLDWWIKTLRLELGTQVVHPHLQIPLLLIRNCERSVKQSWESILSLETPATGVDGHMKISFLEVETVGIDSGPEQFQHRWK